MTRDEMLNRLGKAGEEGLWIEPLLEETQIGKVTIDLRLGCDFLVSILTRRPYISLNRSDKNFRAVSSYFQSTRRELGDTFMLYPNQVVLATTLEYVGLPSDTYADLITRSSYNRLGICVNTMAQPGFRGCISTELLNLGNNPVELVVGAKMFQLRLTKIDEPQSYGGFDRKYLGNVRPTPSRAADDTDLNRLTMIARD